MIYVILVWIPPDSAPPCEKESSKKFCMDNSGDNNARHIRWRISLSLFSGVVEENIQEKDYVCVCVCVCERERERERF